MTQEEILSEVIRICKKYKAEKAILFGSRAKGTAHRTSDFDIAVVGSCDFDEMEEELQDIPTLCAFDIINLDTCKNELLKEEIDKYGKILLC